MRGSPPHPSARARAVVALAVVGAAVGPLVACDLAVYGLGSALLAPSADASDVDAPSQGDDAGGVEGSDDGSGLGSPDARTDGAAGPDATADAVADAPYVCVPTDAGLNGALALSTFVTAGSAIYNENSDGRITLTNSQNDEKGAAWYPTTMPVVSGYDLTWSFRVGPNDTAGDGITFAVLSAGGVPGVGDSGDGLGLRNVAQSDGGIPSGYAVAVDMFQNPSDPTDVGATTLKLVTMPGFRVVAETAVSSPLNDGNVYAVDVSWRAPSSLRATLHAPGGTPVKVSSADPGLTASVAYIGFTAATGGTSDSHNEIAGLTVTETCE